MHMQQDRERGRGGQAELFANCMRMHRVVRVRQVSLNCKCGCDVVARINIAQSSLAKQIRAAVSFHRANMHIHD